MVIESAFAPPGDRKIDAAVAGITADLAGRTYRDEALPAPKRSRIMSCGAIPKTPKRRAAG
jgi:hypothetical protein